MLRKYPESVLLVIVAILLFLMGAMGGAKADCFEDIGCTDSEYFSQKQLKQLSCQNLWHVRNRIYDENGYCFKTKRGKAHFSNEGCSYWNEAAVPLNVFERKNVQSIRAVERWKGCD